MRAFFSSFISFMLSPAVWILLLLLISILAKNNRRKKIYRYAALAVFLLFSNSFLLNIFANKFQPAPVELSPSAHFSCGIVAGGFASPDITGKGIFNASADRFIQALRLYKLGNISHIMITGGNGRKELKTFREAAFVKEQLVIMGVPDSAIIVEDRSENTAENAVNAKKLLDSAGLPAPYLLISSAHHLPRAKLLFEKAGVPVAVYPCSYIAGRGIATAADLLPDVNTLLTWPAFLKEAAAYTWYSR